MDFIESFWANKYFGCSITEFKGDRNIVYPHRYLLGYNGLFIMKYKDKFIVSAPKEKVTVISEHANCGVNLFDEAVLKNCLGGDFARYIGPCWIGYPYEPSITELSNYTVLLNKSDKKWSSVFEDLQPYCDAIEWSHSNIDENSENIAVHYCNNRIVSAASYELWGENVAHIGIITHPLHRNSGFATNVLTLLINFLNAQNLIPQYRTLCSNKSAIKVAEQCGFIEFATHVSVRFR